MTEEDLYLLLEKLLRVQAGGADESEFLIPPQGIEAFLARAQGRAGEQYFRNPRDTIKDFLQILAVLEQHPDRSWADLLATQPTPAGAPETSAAPAEQGDDDVNELKEFRL